MTAQRYFARSNEADSDETVYGVEAMVDIGPNTNL